MSFSLVPGFAQRYPKDDEENPSQLNDSRPARPDADSLVRPDRTSLLTETCCTTLDEALAAQTRAANRIELCTDLSVGGLTPPRDLIRTVISSLTIPVNVLIRPSSRDAFRGCPRNRLAALDPSQADLGPLPLTLPRVAWVPDASPSAQNTRVEAMGFSAEDFVYDEADLQQMIEDIEYCKSVGAAGVVVGALTPEGAIDLQAMRRLIAAARPLPVTFHRAFDVCTEDPFTALDKLIALGCTRLLSSGQAPTAWDGRNLLNLLVRRAGHRLIVMPGCGITPDKLPALAAATHAPEFHGTRIP